MANEEFVVPSFPGNKFVRKDEVSSLVDSNRAVETPTGTINGSNVTFTLANTPLSNSLQLFINGQLMTQPEDYSISGTTITFETDHQPQSGQVLRAFYSY